MVAVRPYLCLTFLVLIIFSGPHSEVQKACLAHAERLGKYLASKGNSSADVLLT